MLAICTLGFFLLFAAYVNLNDPDAAFWSTAYAASAVVCVWTAASSRPNAFLSQGCAAYAVASLVLAAYSFSLLPASRQKISGESGAFGIFELEPIREGGGALIMALAMGLCASQASPSTPDGAVSSSGGKAGGGGVSTVMTVSAVVIAVTGIYLGVTLPAYYNKLGVSIPDHCGGAMEANPLR
ncbi:unnamed protein product [Phaeothamnion confervicola]